MAKHKILVINPNSNRAMTETLRPILDALKFDDITYELFTSLHGPRSINNDQDAHASASYCQPLLVGDGKLDDNGNPVKPALVDGYSALLVACYSGHPLVPILRAHRPAKPVLGIFEASVAAALNVCGQASRMYGPPMRVIPLTWGIVTTGKAWEPLLEEACAAYLTLDKDNSIDSSTAAVPIGRFAGVQSTGLDADELHEASAELLRERMAQATAKLLEQGKGKDGRCRLGAVVLGCAGMAELEAVVRETVPADVRIIDGVKAGYCALATMLMCGV